MTFVKGKNKKKVVAAESSDDEDQDDAKSVVSNVSSNAPPPVKAKGKKGQFLLKKSIFCKKNHTNSYLILKMQKTNKPTNKHTFAFIIWVVILFYKKYK